MPRLKDLKKKSQDSRVRMSLVQLFETGFFEKIECLVKTIKKCFLKKLSVWLALIDLAVLVVNYQKGQGIYKGVYFILKPTT